MFYADDFGLYTWKAYYDEFVDAKDFIKKAFLVDTVLGETVEYAYMKY